MYKKVISVIFFFISFLFITKTVIGADYSTSYNAEYVMNEDGSSDVNLTIKIVYLNPNIYVKEFTLVFPESFSIDQITARDIVGKIDPKLSVDDDRVKLSLLFNDIDSRAIKENFLYLHYNQKNLFKIHGNTWEVILPTLIGDDSSIFNLQVILPHNANKKISIAKPKPSKIERNIIYWDNVKTRTIYAVFGDSEYYKTTLSYHLENNGIKRVYYDLAFPPDMSFQKVYVLSISPAPEKVFIDDDGNYLGRYILNTKEKKDIVFEGVIETTSKLREEPSMIDKKRIDLQKQYLLTPHSYWDLGKFMDNQDIKKLKNISDIYAYTKEKLTYNYNRISKNMVRIGAEGILKDPDQAVCMEFTDLFIALAREKGIYSRELNGYGFSDMDRFRPQLLNTDILHSWPQYYDEERLNWISVDPTWENTSGIDYFSSLDLNHITFVIHGKEQNYPISAGMYKTEESKDVKIDSISSLPKELKNISVVSDLPKNILDDSNHKAKILVKNIGNTFIYNFPLKAESKGVSVSLSKDLLEVLAPYQEEEIILTIEPTKSTKKYIANIYILSNEDLLLEENITIISLVSNILTIGAGIIIGVIIIILLFYFFGKKKHNDKSVSNKEST